MVLHVVVGLGVAAYWYYAGGAAWVLGALLLLGTLNPSNESGRSAIWGGATAGVVLGLGVGLFWGGLAAGALNGAAIGAALGLVADVMGGMADFLRARRRSTEGW